VLDSLPDWVKRGTVKGEATGYIAQPIAHAAEVMIGRVPVVQPGHARDKAANLN
jgi:hypothetical protein